MCWVEGSWQLLPAPLGNQKHPTQPQREQARQAWTTKAETLLQGEEKDLEEIGFCFLVGSFCLVGLVWFFKDIFI